jgi:8-oxo-dGTP pyrophosphatase MutT (NUDIX family)
MRAWALGWAGWEGGAVAKAKRRRPRLQYAALPLSWDADGQRLVMLVTSRETRRWVIPKGWAEKDLAPHEVAAKEAREEAGLEGEIGREPVAAYRYLKRLRGKKTVTCEVTVFPLAVARQLDDWPEKGQRQTRWLAPAEAALLVDEGGLVALLLELAAPDG